MSNLLIWQRVVWYGAILYAAQDLAVAQQDAPAPQTPNSSSNDLAEKRFVLPRKHHPWTKFEPEAWREVRISTETFNPDGTVASRSVTIQIEALKAIAEGSYTLEVQATIDLAGKRITGDRQTRQLNMLTDSTAHIGTTHRLEPAELTIDGRTVRCEVWKLTAQDEQHKYRQQIFYAPNQWPFVLQRENSELSDMPEAEPHSKQSSQVVALSVPYLVGGKPVSCSCTKVVRQSNKGTTVRMELQADNVPGGVVAAWVIDTDAQRQPSRWSLLELIDFGTTVRTE